MKRIGLIFALLAAAAATVVTTAGADGNRTYEAELFNAFGLVKGSEARIGGVKAGSVTDLDITANKTALITFEVGPDFPELKSDASCSSEPQSLIAEYFLDCQPGSSDQPLEGPIPADRNGTTVQSDLVNNILREPFKRRFQLIINEFGTALVGNPENLNSAILAGAPALRELRQVLKILGRQNHIIAQLNTDSDAIFAQLTARKEDVVRFIDNAGHAAEVSAERRDELSRNFEILDDFLFELKPVMHELGNLAREQTPLLTDLQAAAPGLNKLGGNLPRFQNATKDSLVALGGAAQPGKRALQKAQDEITALNNASLKAPAASDIIARFLESIDDPRNAVEEDGQARTDLAGMPGEADRRVGILNQKVPGGGITQPGYTGMEGLLNYAYVQANSLNFFDQLGHALHFTLVSAPGSPTNPCVHYQAGPTYETPGGGQTTDLRNAVECISQLGNHQPGINYGTNPSGLFGHLPPYDPSVCPDPDGPGGVSGSTNWNICRPLGSRAAGFNGTAPAAAPAAPVTPDQIDQVKGALEGLNPKEQIKKIQEILGLPPGVQLPTTPTVPSLPSATGNTAANNLLGFLVGP